MSLSSPKSYQEVYLQGFKKWRNRAKNSSEAQEWKEFVNSIKNSLRLLILFDADIIKVLSDSIDSQIAKPNIEQICQYLNDIKEFSNILQRRGFIDNLLKSQIIQKVNLLNQSNQDIKLRNLSKFLSVSSDQNQFEEDWNQRNTISSYDSFWQHHLKQNKLSTKGLLNSIYQKFVSFDLDQQLNQSLRQRLSKYFHGMDGANAVEIQLNEKLQNISNVKLLRLHSPARSQFNQEYDKIKFLITQFKSTFDGDKNNQKFQMKMGKFGSLQNGFATTEADLDITILTNCYIQEKKLIEALGIFLEFKLKDTDYRVKKLTNANIPIVQIQKGERGKVQKIDIAVNNICGIINSKLLYVYSELHTGIRSLGVLIKLWGKNVKIIDATKMSSYSMILMMLYYLIKMKEIPNILRSVRNTERQNQCIKIKRQKKGEKEEFIIWNTFETDPKKIKGPTKFNIYKHLLGFMNFYKADGQYFQQKHAISLDLSDKSLEQDKIYTIKDPFDQPHNPGRVGISYKDEILRQFENAYRTLKNKKVSQIAALFGN